MCAASISTPAAAGRPSRRPAALDPAWAPLDDRGTAELIARAPGYARLLNFFEPDGSISGNWSGFWDGSDLIFLLAEMAEMDSVAERSGDGSHAAQEVVRLIKRIGSWLAVAQKNEAAHLDQPTATMLLTLTAVGESRLRPAYQALEPTQQQHVLRALAHAPGVLALLETKAEDSGTEIIFLAALCRAAEDHLAQMALRFLAPALDPVQPGSHPAHATLYLAFLKLFGTLQGDMNRFTGRHLAYYYDEVLALAPQAGRSDYATLVFALTASGPDLLLKAGTMACDAPKDGALPQRYALERDTQLSQARIAALATIRLMGEVQQVTGICAAPLAASADGLGAPLAQPQAGWPTFGHTKTIPGKLAATAGLIVASPVLLLTEGTRDVWLRLTLDLAAIEPVMLDVLPASAFLLYASGADGWQALDGFVVEIDLAAGSPVLVMHLTLKPGDAALVPNGAPPPRRALLPDVALAPPGAASAALPMLMLLLNPAAPHYAYSRLAHWKISAIDINVTVSGLATLKIDNGGGPGAPGKPFLPFGAVPVPGASFRLAHPELSAKTLDRATVNVRWLNLPLPVAPSQAPLTFEQYYAGYDPYTFSDEGFLLSAAVCRGGAWQPVGAVCGADSDGQFAMFGMRAGLPQPESVWLLPLADAPVVKERPAPKTAPGTLQLTFEAPTYGFGQAQFPQLFAAQALRNALLIEDKPLDLLAWLVWLRLYLADKLVCLLAWMAWCGAVLYILPHNLIVSICYWIRGLPLPVLPWPDTPQCVVPPDPPSLVELNSPFLPTIAAVSVDYSATASVPLAVALYAAPQCFHVSPFGTAPVLAAGQALEPVPLLSPMHGAGQLCIGLAGLTPGLALSMHFELRTRPGAAIVIVPGQTAGDRPGRPSQTVTWRYLAGHRWHKFHADAVDSTTENLGRSGIVTLQVPADICQGDSVMGKLGDNGTSWIAACIDSDPDDCPDTVEVLLHAASAVRVVAQGSAGPVATVAAQTITALALPQAAVKSVRQPFASHGGLADEPRGAFEVRVSERLRHKQRASQLRDYEQMILVAFPEMWQVACIGPRQRTRSTASWIEPGTVTLVVVPPFGTAPEQAAPIARPVLAAIADSVQGVAPTSLQKICVRNVAYEWLCVDVALHFLPETDAQQCIVGLNAAICARLSPWLAQAEPQLEIGGGAVPVASLESLVLGYPGVASIVGVLSLIQRAQSDLALLATCKGNDIASPSTPWSVLVPQQQHRITVAPPPREAAHA